MAKKTRHVASKVDRLPAQIRDQVAAMRASGHTIDEILAWLRQMPIDPAQLPSRAGLGVHVQGLDKLAEQVNFGRRVAEALVRPLGDAPESRQARLNIELMHGITTKLLMARLDTKAPEGDGADQVTFSAQEVMFLGRALKDLASAQGMDAKTTLALREGDAKSKSEPDADAPQAVVEFEGTGR